MACLLAGNSVASSVVEGSFWKERRKSVLAGARTYGRSAVPLALTTGWPAPGLVGLSGQTVDPPILETLPIQASRDRSQSNDDPLFPVLSKMVRSLPNEWGTVRSIALPPGPLRRIVVHIQDIHEHIEAQTHISRAVGNLLSTGVVDVVGLEGAFAPLALEPFRRFPHRDTLEIVADDLLKRHVISGPVHGGMLSEQTSVPFVGVDDEIHHCRNVEAYRQSLKTRAENVKRLDKVDRLLESRKEAVFSPSLLKWDRSLRAYREGKVGLAQHVETLSSYDPCLPPQLKILQKAVALEKIIDFDQAEQERTEVVKRLVQGLSEQALAELAAQSATFKAGRLSHGAFYGYLKRLCESTGLPWGSYSAFSGYVDYVLMAQSLRMDQVQKELLSAGQTTSTRLARSKEEKSLLAESDQLRLLSLLITFTLTPAEWGDYKDQAFPQILLDLVSDRNVYESFYREAEQRDNAMSTRLLEAMGTGKNQTAVLVAGGFHSAGLRKLLTTQGTAVVEFVPRVTKIEPNSGSTYLSVFNQDKTPLDQLFTAEKLFVAKSPMAPTTPFEATGLCAVFEASRGGLSADKVERHFLSEKFRSRIKRINTKLSNGKTSVVFFFNQNAYRFTHYIYENAHVFKEGPLLKKRKNFRRPPLSFVTARFLARVLPWSGVKRIVRTGRLETLLTSAYPPFFAEVVYYLGLNTGVIYRSYTQPGRLAAVDKLMIHLGIGHEGEGPLLYDVGPGFPPMTSYEMGKNTGGRVVTYETGNPTYLVTLGTVGKNGESPLYLRFNEKKELLSVWRYGGNGGLNFKHFLLARYLLLHYLLTGDQLNIGTVRKDPSLLSLNPKISIERRSGNLFSGLDAPAGEYADAVRVANVLWFQDREDEFGAIEKLGRHLRVGGKIYIVDGGAEQMEIFVYEKTENYLVARFYAASCDPGNENRFEENLGTDRYGTRGWLFNSFAAQRKEISRITSELHKQQRWSPQAVADELSVQFPGVTSVGNLYLFPLSAEGEAKPVPDPPSLTQKLRDGVVKWFSSWEKALQAWNWLTADKKGIYGLLISATLVAVGYTIDVIVLFTIFQVFATLAFIGNLLFSLYFLWISHIHLMDGPLLTERFVELPMVTIQLPMYNEANVAERVIRAAAAVDYPREKLEIQVLDDSTDHTQELIQRVVEELKQSGINMVLVHRENRKGYKAGALREGLKTARGEFIAIFDADFVVPRDFLQRTIHYFTSDKVAMVEGRWGHLNRNRSYLTQAQASWLDAHMFIEQGGKNREGLWVHFHGTGGVWRKTAITDAGGWLERTVTEDGDLSYRALLRGWNMVYLRDYESPAELPPTMQAYLAQQYRWHKGGAQVFKFLVGGLVHSSYSAKIKMTTLHRLVNPFLSPVSLFSILLLPIVYLLGANVYLLNVGWILLWSVLTPAWLIIEAITYRTARLHVEGEDWSNKTFLQRWSLLPIGVMLNIGTIVHKSWAVVDALFGKSLVFERTPKYNSVDGQNVPNFKEPYKPKRLKTLDLLTLGAALYALTGSLYFGFLGIYTPALFYLFNSISFLWVGITPFLESRPAREHKAKLPPAQTPLTHRVWSSFGRFFPEEWHASVKAEARFTAGWEFFLHWVFPSLLVYAATAGLGMVGVSVSPEKLIPALAPVWGIVFYNSHRERGPPLAGMTVYLTTLYGFGALFLSWGGGFVFLGVTLVAFGLAGHMAYDTKYIPLNSAELTERDRQNMAELADKTENNVREKPNELPILDDILSQPITPLGVGEKYRMAQELVRDIQQPQGARELKAALREKGVDVSNIESIRDFFASILPGRSQLFFVSRKDELTEDQWETMGATLRSRYRPGEVVIVVPPHPDVALRQILTRHGLESFIAVVPNDGYVHVGTGGKWILAAVERIPLVRRALAGSPFVSLYSVPSAVFDRAGAVSDNFSEAAQRVHSLWEALNSFSIQRTRLEIVDILARAVQQSA